MTERFASRKADIPLPPAVHHLNSLFREYGEPLFAVGGAVRDFLFAQNEGKDYEPKDIDLSTQATPQEIIEILNGNKARELGFKCFPKGESFGVISAVFEGQEYEIATFRQEWYDPEEGDGRRPDKVWFATPGADAARRDLTINALFYDIDGREIRDYNVNPEGVGQGFEDIENRVARPVGNARDRFQEDKLRILRLVRFFNRFSDERVIDKLDEGTLAAIDEFKDLKGVSPERIAAEFQAGLAKAKSPSRYMENYHSLGLLSVVFNGLHLPNFPGYNLGNCRNLKAVLAWVLRLNYPDFTRQALNRLKYSSDVADRVEFLMDLRTMNGTKIVGLLKRRDLYKQLKDEDAREAAKAELFQDVRDLAKLVGQLDVEYFLAYEPVAKSKDFLHLQGRAIGEAMADLESAVYLNGLVADKRA